MPSAWPILTLRLRLLPAPSANFPFVRANSKRWSARTCYSTSLPPSREATLQEFARLLSPKGTLLIRAAARRGIGKKKHRDTSRYQQWEPQKLRVIVNNAGFEVIFLALVNWLPSLLADLGGLGKPAPVGDEGLRVRAMPAHSWKSRILAAYWCVERGLILRLGWRPPGGHTLFCVARKRCPNRTS